VKLVPAAVGVPAMETHAAPASVQVTGSPRRVVDERDVGRVARGAAVRIRANAFPGVELTGKVEEVGLRMGRKNVRTDDPAERNDTKILIKRTEWPAYYSSKIKPDFVRAKNHAQRIHDSCTSLEASNKSHFPLSTIVNFMGGTSTRRPGELSIALAARFQIPEKDIERHAQAVKADECVASLREAIDAVNDADRGLNAYYRAVGRGGEHTITVIKIGAATAIGLATGGVGAAAVMETAGGAMAAAAVEGVATEGATLILKAFSPGEKVGWSDVKSGLVGVGTKTLGAGAGKLLGPAIAKLIKIEDRAAKEALERFIEQSGEDVVKAAVEAKDAEDFAEKVKTAGLKSAGKAVAGGKLGGAAAEGVDAARQ
jgi:hypothetical protein